MSAIALKYALIALAVLLVVGGLWWAAKRPNRSRQHPGRLRMPVFIAFVGWALVSVGFLMGLIAFNSWAASDLLAMRIASVAIAAGGAVFLVMYRNWYVFAGPEEVRFRTVLGQERVIVYSDIVDYRMREVNGQPMLQVRSSAGVKLRVDTRIYPVEALLEAVAFRHRMGRWPGRG